VSALFWIECACCGIGLAITANTLNNRRAFRRLTDYASGSIVDAPFVSVLIPARNEERSIAACLDSLIAQEYPAYEVLILDDGSDDRTADIVHTLCLRSDRIRLIPGASLPEGWYGKAYACDQLGKQARGDTLIFTDADTVHAPVMIRSVVGAIAAGADVVTAFPEQETGSISERLAVSFMLFTVWAFLPVGRVWSDPSPRFVAANGQLLAFTRAAYMRAGGHAAVRRSVLDDVDLARRAKRCGLRVYLTDGVGAVRTRMYRGLAEVWCGFSKNALALTGGSIIGAALCAAVLALLYVMPFVILLTGVIGQRDGWTWRLLPASLILLMCVQVGIAAKRTRGSLWQVAFHPFSVLFFLIILANSVRWRVRGYRVWKGRSYPVGGPARDTPTAPAPEEQ
jgi:chlorobactene glucosyltransferase